jgi:hypothetical protein
VELLVKWSRRHAAAVASAAVLLVLAVVGLSIGIVLIGLEKAKTEQERDRVARSVEDLRRQDYVNRVNIALREVLDDNVALAEDLLYGCPADLRGWEWSYVERLCHSERLTLGGHAARGVQCVALRQLAKID